MPVKPVFDWEQTVDDVIVTVIIKGFKKDAIDVFISDAFVKVNAAPTYLLQLDLLHTVIVEKSTFRVDLPKIRIVLPKATQGIAWETLCLADEVSVQDRLKRRHESLERAEKLYNMKLDTREKQKEVEKKRMFNEQWELEKEQRRDIEKRYEQEKSAERQSLSEWEGDIKKAHQVCKSPADILYVPQIRGAETVTVPIDFTRKTYAMPSRSRGDEDYYRKSRYKPVSVQDSPMFWKEKGDAFYKARDWKGAADAYSESIKRDGCFLTCVANRAACFLHLHQYKKAIEDCDLAITLLSNTPASDTTHDTYRNALMKLHVRRGAAYCWDDQLARGLEDYRLAAAYRTPEDDVGIVDDVTTIQKRMAEKGLDDARDPAAEKRSEANNDYHHGNYAGAVAIYRELLEKNEFDVKARSNLSATLLQQGAFQEALVECDKIIAFCQDAAQALSQPGAQASTVDSDDEEECQDEMVAKKNEAAKTLRERSGHIYLLLKSYVRAAAANCGLNDFRKAYEIMELAVRITPYDDDLRDDANRILEKLKFKTLVDASTSKQKPA